uniref:Uncharacterized protein n=1 Tax=Opuntia streptacantha TaxID=393608 RepID=A0A7C8YHE1_OPUST
MDQQKPIFPSWQCHPSDLWQSYKIDNGKQDICCLNMMALSFTYNVGIILKVAFVWTCRTTSQHFYSGNRLILTGYIKAHFQIEIHASHPQLGWDCKDSKCSFSRDQENRSNVKIPSHIAVTMRFGQFKNISNAAVSLWICHILNPWLGIVFHSVQDLHLHLPYNSNGDEA